jgi:signal transduction histidine kinase
MRPDHRDAYQAWLWGELLLLGLLGAALALFIVNPALGDTYELPQVRLFLDTAIVLAGSIVALLAGIRFSVEGRRLDLLLCAGFSVAAGGGLAFTIAPLFGGGTLGAAEAWAGVGAKLLAGVLIAAAPFSSGRIATRRRAMWATLAGLALALVVVWLSCRGLGAAVPAISLQQGNEQPLLLIFGLAALALVHLIAAIGFGLRFRARAEDLDRWLSLAATLSLFAELHFMFTPRLSSSLVSEGDFLRLLSYGVLLVGVWRAIRYAEFGRAVAEERARVAREIHDGLAQYLFAIATSVTMLQRGAPLEPTIMRLREATAAAQQEARFAVLALSSAGGTAPFDAALRRYVEFLTADGELEVDVDIDENMRLAPDEQIEVFRIVQEGLANVRKHAHATRAVVQIGQRDGERLVTIVDDGEGFDGETAGAGQGLKNIKARTRGIDGDFRVKSQPGQGTALEVVLRT